MCIGLQLLLTLFNLELALFFEPLDRGLLAGGNFGVDTLLESALLFIDMVSDVVLKLAQLGYLPVLILRQLFSLKRDPRRCEG